MAYPPSKYQEHIYDIWKTTNQNVLVGAVAGSGKTSTSIGMMERSSPSIPKLYLAFNKSIQKEITTKVSHVLNVQALTLHSLGMRSMFKYFKNLEVSEKKIWIIGSQVNKKHWQLDNDEFKKTIIAISQMVDLWRMTLCRDASDMLDVAQRMTLDFTLDDILRTEDIVNAYAEYNKNPKMIDFTDMIYIPTTDPKFTINTRAKMVWIDECQDLNPLQHMFVDKLIKQNKARWAAFGDKHQAIYGFAGADSKSFDLFKLKKNVIDLPLSICYRCGDEIIDEANTVFKDADGNPYILVEKNTHKGTGRVERAGDQFEIQEGDMVVCRNTKPLVELFFDLLDRDIPAKIKGSDIGKGLIKLIEPFKLLKSHRTIKCIEEKMELKLLELREMGVKSPLAHHTYTGMMEKKQICIFVAEKYSNTSEMISFFKRIFTDKDFKGVVLCTIHKSKGLENSRVFFLNSSLIPSKYASTEEQLRQERNLRYVAITRAEDELIYLDI